MNSLSYALAAHALGSTLPVQLVTTAACSMQNHQLVL